MFFAFLPNDMLYEIVKYMTPHDFKSLFESINDETMKNNLKKCTIICTTVIEDDFVNWFELNEIQIELLYYVVNYLFVTKSYLNGKLHSPF